MPNISQRGIDMPASPIRKLAPFAVAAKQKGIKVYHLNIGQPDIATPQEGLDALKNIDRKVLEYSPATSSSPAVVARHCSLLSSLASTLATNSSFPNPCMPTIWALPTRWA